MSANPECSLDAAPYVLGALEAEEADAFQSHLSRCPTCQAEVSELSVAVQALPLAVPPQPVPKGLKRRVMADVRADARARPRPRPRSRSLRRFGWPQALPLAGAGRGLVAGAMALVIAVVIGALTLGSGTAGTRVIHARVGWPGAAVLRVSGGRGELVVQRMPAPPSGKVYEVWLKRGAQAPAPTSALFDVTSAGAASVDVPGDLHGVSAVMVTPEPRGGSARPTHAAVLVARL